MTLKEIACQFDELYMQLWKLDGMAMAINIAICEGGLSGKAYDGALSALSDMTFDSKEKANKLIAELFTIVKSEKDVA